MDVNWDPLFGAFIAALGVWMFRIGRQHMATSDAVDGVGRIESVGGALGVMTGTLLLLGAIG